VTAALDRFTTMPGDLDWGSITDQLELAGWHDAWRHEMRGRHGEWVKGEEAAQSGGLMHRIDSFMRDQGGYRPAGPAVHQFAADAASKTSGLLGGGHQTFTGDVQVAPKLESPDSLAEMGWDGTMNIRGDVAEQLSDDLAGTGEIRHPDNFHTVLHELIHSNVAEGKTYGDGQRAYQDLAHAWIEEGFTELGATQHSEEFFRAMGAADRPVSSGMTMAALARNRADDREPGSWGHYAEQEDIAHAWLEEIAAREGVPEAGRQARINKLADDLNRVGVEDKVQVMARQIISALGGKEESPQLTASVEQEIVGHFGHESGEETARHAAQAALAAMAAERAA
jgi:hypothetical protein